MTIPFLNLFKKAKSRFGKPVQPAPVVIQRPPVIEKSAEERLSKTVMPNTTRTVAPADPFEIAAGKGRRDSVPLGPATAPEDRAITLSLSDVLEKLPAASLKPEGNFDLTRTISIKAAEVEKGMSKGQPMAMLSSIYHQVPEIFQHRIAPDDLSQVALPYDKVLQQFAAFQVRTDQTEDQAVPQVDTPFLQVTIEDTKKFGTNLEPLQASAKPPVKVEPATARAIAKAEPEPVAQKKVAAPSTKVRHRVPMTPPASVPAPPAAVDPSASPARIPFNLPPNGAGAPASERVPASSGPPVPTPSAQPPKATTPTRIPFKMTPPGPDLKPKKTLVPGVEPAESAPPQIPASAEAARSSDTTVKLRLNVCLRNVPAFQLKGSVPEIPDDVVMELPWSVIEPQLASGRVAVDPKLFKSAIPENFRENFVIDSTETPVLLPLQEVLQRIPMSALQMRHDQEKEEAVNYFETPFSKQADEDQKLFSKPTEAKAGKPKAETLKVEEPKAEQKSEKPADKAAEMKAEAPASGEKSEKTSAEPEKKPAVEAKEEKPEPTAKAKVKGKKVEEPVSPSPATTAAEPKEKSAAEQKTSDLEAKHNAKEFVLKASCLPGVSACSISFADGLTMADNFPPGIGAEGLCAVAPSLLQKIAKHMPETNLGAFTAMTLHCEKSPLTFFMKGNVCLSVLHADKELEPVTREQLADMTKELAQIFAQPETTHVDH